MHSLIAAESAVQCHTPQFYDCKNRMTTLIRYRCQQEWVGIWSWPAVQKNTDPSVWVQDHLTHRMIRGVLPRWDVVPWHNVQTPRCSHLVQVQPRYKFRVWTYSFQRKYNAGLFLVIVRSWSCLLRWIQVRAIRMLLGMSGNIGHRLSHITGSLSSFLWRSSTVIISPEDEDLHDLFCWKLLTPTCIRLAFRRSAFRAPVSSLLSQASVIIHRNTGFFQVDYRLT